MILQFIIGNSTHVYYSDWSALVNQCKVDNFFIFLWRFFVFILFLSIRQTNPHVFVCRIFLGMNSSLQITHFIFDFLLGLEKYQGKLCRGYRPLVHCVSCKPALVHDRGFVIYGPEATIQG